MQIQVERAGINGLISNTGTNSHSQLQTPEVDDPRQAKLQLTADLGEKAARAVFLSSLSDALTDEELLHRCLLPITVTVQVTAIRRPPLSICIGSAATEATCMLCAVRNSHKFLSDKKIVQHQLMSHAAK